MKKEHFHGLIITIIVLIISSFLFFNNIRKTKSIGKQLYKEFPRIELDEYLYGKVTDISHGDPNIFRNDPHHAYITINNEIKKRLITSFELKTDMFLDDVIEVGDRIFKESGSDTINLLKLKGGDTINFQFEMRDDLRYPLKKRN